MKRLIRFPWWWGRAVCLAGVVFVSCVASEAVEPFGVQGPGVDPSDFRVTVFAEGLDYPVGMAELSDGSLLVAVSEGNSFYDSTGEIIRLVDGDGDGVADEPGTVLFTGLTGGQSALRLCGNLVFVTGQGAGKPISVLRLGATPDAKLTKVGEIDVNYPGDWYHPHSALGVRTTPGKSGSCDLLFQLGSDENHAKTTRTATISSEEIAGASGTIEGESIYMLTISDYGTHVEASNLRLIALGLRNAAGFAFHPVTGDLYFEDNGIDGAEGGNEPLSADELNFIRADEVGNGTMPDFGFPENYTTYRSGTVVGGGGVQPLVTFQPLPDPLTGSESEGPNDIAFAPPGFPPGLNNGVFVGFHGKWSRGGIANEENPLVFVDLNTTNYFHFVSNDEPEVGHFDGLLSTEDSLFVADMTSTGSPGLGNGTGVIYQIKSLVPRLRFQMNGDELELRWSSGVLEVAPDLAGPWDEVGDGSGGHRVEIDPEEPAQYFRTKTE